MNPSRRGIVMGSASIGTAWTLAGAAAAGSGPWSGMDEGWLQQSLETYANFGGKASGGTGDSASGAWLQKELERVGYTCERQAFDVPWFEPTQSTLTIGSDAVGVLHMGLSAATGPEGLSAPLRVASAADGLAGAIAVAVLPYKRWVTVEDPVVRRAVDSALDQGARALLLVTTGPSGEAIALNVSPRHPPFDRPIAILSPRDAGPILEAADHGRLGKLTIDGPGGQRPAFNLIARLNRGAAKTLILSTPRSGWFQCTAERGSGLVVWLALARWLAQSDHRINIEVVATSGHEYEYIGGEHYLREAAPRPANTEMWVHIGASAAARDWHEFFPVLEPLPTADSQRVLTATEDIIHRVRPAFAGVSGLEATYVANAKTAGGELTNVLKAGYPSAIGLYGVHRYFHTQGDDLRCTSGSLVKPVADAFRAALAACLG